MGDAVLETDWYAVLGVSPEADAAALRAAYRKRAWALHPDRGGDDGGAAFQRLSAAYAVLSDAGRRAAYDRERAGLAAPAADRAERPLRCSECGRITAQPRLLVFQSVRSLLFWSWTARTEGIFCAPCARRTAWRCSLVASVAGWWALPFGPVLTSRAVLANGRGGLSHAATNDRLLLLNAKAFLARDHEMLAYAIAQRVSQGPPGPIAREARQLLVRLGRTGPMIAPPLKDAWAPNRADWPLHVALATWLPLTASAAALLWLAL